MRIAQSLFIAFLAFALIPPNAWPLAPRSKTQALQDRLKRFENVRRNRKIDPDSRNKADNATLDIFSQFLLVFEPEDIEQAMRDTGRIRLQEAANTLKGIGVASVMEVVDGMSSDIPPRVWSEAFADDPNAVAAIFRLCHADISGAKWLVHVLGSDWVLDVLENKFSTNWKRLEKLLKHHELLRDSLGDTDQDLPAPTFSIPRVLPRESWFTALRSNPDEFILFAQGARLIGSEMVNCIFLELAQNEHLDFRTLRQAFETNPNACTLQYTGLLFDRLALLCARWNRHQRPDRLNYFHRLLSPSLGPPLWAELGGEIQNTYGIELRPFGCYVQAVSRAMVNLPTPYPSNHMTLSLVLDRDELDMLAKKGKTLTDPEIGAVQFLIEENTILVLEIQNYWKDRHEKISAFMTRRYQHWPYLLMLALEDYALQQGLEEIVIVAPNFVMERWTLNPEKMKRQFSEKIQWTYATLPQLSGYLAESISPRQMDDSHRKAILRSVHRKDLTKVAPSRALAIFRALCNLNPVMGSLRRRSRQGLAWAPLGHVRLQECAEGLAELLRLGQQANIPTSQLVQKVRRQWARSTKARNPLRWNYILSMDEGLAFHGMSLSGVDFVFQVDTTGKNPVVVERGKFPALLSATEIQKVSGQGALYLLNWDRKLSGWTTGSVVSVFPTLWKWVHGIRSKEPQRGFLQRHIAVSLARLIYKMPTGIREDSMKNIVMTLDERLGKMEDSDKPEFLRILTACLPSLLEDPQETAWVGRFARLVHQALGSHLQSGSEVMYRAASLQPKNLQALIAGAEALESRYDNVGKRNEAMIFYAATKILADPSTPELPTLVLELYDRLAKDASPLRKNDAINHLLALASRAQPLGKPLIPIFRAALGRDQQDLQTLNHLLDGLVLLYKARQTALIAELTENISHETRLEAMQDILERTLEPFHHGDIMSFDYPMPNLLLRLMEAIRQSGAVEDGQSTFFLGLSLENFHAYPVTEIQLFPSGVLRKEDEALQLLDLDFGGEFTEAPRGALVWLELSLAQVGEKTCLVLLERQSSKGYWRLLSLSQKRPLYRRCLVNLVERVVSVSGRFPQIDMVISLSAEELEQNDDFSENMSRDVLREWYGNRHLAGFQRQEVSDSMALSFADQVACNTNAFKGPFYVMHLSRSKEGGENTNRDLQDLLFVQSQP